MQFGVRLVSDGLCGAAIGATGSTLIAGLAAGVIGAMIGTLGGYEVRARLVKLMGKDLPAALTEDLIAVGGAVLIVASFS
jgi:uncharacterized membrane protein